MSIAVAHPLTVPVARPARTRRTPRPAARASVASCKVSRPRFDFSGLWLRVKVAAVAVLAVAGTVVSVAEFTSWSQADPAVEYVEGHPAWAHVEGN